MKESKNNIIKREKEIQNIILRYREQIKVPEENEQDITAV